MLKWISSFPRQPGGRPADGDGHRAASPTRGRPSRSRCSTPASVTALRTGAVGRGGGAGACARPDAATVGSIGCGLHGAWAARCLAADGYGPGVCFDPSRRGRRARWRPSWAGWRAGRATEALACDVVCCVTPGVEPVVGEATCVAGLHLNMLGADGPGKAEATIEAVARCELFCDEWEQASHGGELTGAVDAGRVAASTSPTSAPCWPATPAGASATTRITLFDSTGLAIQDLAVAAAALDAHRAGRVDGRRVELQAEPFAALDRRLPALHPPAERVGGQGLGRRALDGREGDEPAVEQRLLRGGDPRGLAVVVEVGVVGPRVERAQRLDDRRRRSGGSGRCRGS